MHDPNLDNIPTRCTEADLPEILAVQKLAYEERLIEEAGAFISKIAASPETCFLIRDRDGLGAYLITLACTEDTIPALNNSSQPRSEDADVLYIHDLAVNPNAAGRGYGTKLVKHALAVATDLGLEKAYLVAVQNSDGFWAKFGFKTVEDLDVKSREKLASYGEGAVFMTMSLDVPAAEERFDELNFPEREASGIDPHVA